MTDQTNWDDHNRTVAQACLPVVEMYINGLITDYEFLRHMASIANQARIPNMGVLDHTTGLRYTPEMVMGYVGITGKVGFDGLE